MSESSAFTYDKVHRWWTKEAFFGEDGLGRDIAAMYERTREPSVHYVDEPGPAPDPVWVSVKARRKRNEETGLPL